MCEGNGDGYRNERRPAQRKCGPSPSVRVRRVWGSSQTRLGFDSDAGNAGSEEPLSGGRFRCAAAIEVRRDAAVPESEPTAE